MATSHLRCVPSPRQIKRRGQLHEKPGVVGPLTYRGVGMSIGMLPSRGAIGPSSAAEARHGVSK